MMSVYNYYYAAKDDIEALEQDRLELLNDFKEQLAVFCEHLYANLDQQSIFQSLNSHTNSAIFFPHYQTNRCEILKTPLSVYLRSKLVEIVKSTATKTVQNLAIQIADSSQKLLCEDFSLRGSTASIAEKLVLRYLFSHLNFDDIEAIPKVPLSRNNQLLAFSEFYLLDHVEKRYTENYHKYKIWDGRAVSLFSSLLFDLKNEYHPFFHLPDLRFLLENNLELITIELFKDESIACWTALLTDGPKYLYTELAYPDDNGLIFEEYVPLNMVCEEVWESLYERYRNKWTSTLKPQIN